MTPAELKGAFVYVHLEADTGAPFYVGIGTKKTRPFQLYNRSKYHKSIVSKHGVRVEIVTDDLDWEVAKFWEIHWIKALRDAGFRLANLTDGGDGTCGYKHTEEARKKISVRMKINNPLFDPEVAEKLSGDNHWTRQNGVLTNFHMENNPSKKPENIARMLYSNPMSNPEIAERVAQKNRGRKLSKETIEKSASKRRGVPKTAEQKQASGAGVKHYWDRLTEEERKERGTKRKAAHDAKTPDERSSIANKGWIKRRRRYSYWGA